MGSNHGPTRMALAEATARGARSATCSSRSTPTSTCCASTRTSPGSSSTTPPTPPGSCSGRTSRSSGATRAASARSGPPGPRDGRPARPPPEHRAVVRAQRAARGRPRSRASRSAPRDVARTGGVDVPADVEQGRARPLDHAARCTRPTPPAPVDPHSGVLPGLGSGGHRHPLLLRLVPRPDGRPRAARCARSRAWPASSPSSARRPSPTRGLHGAGALARPRLGRPLRAPRAARSCTSTSTSRPTTVRLVRGVARRDAALPGRAHPAAGRGPPPAQARPDRRLLPLLLRRRPSRGHVVRARPRPGRRRPATARCATPAGPCCRCSSPAPGSSTW